MMMSLPIHDVLDEIKTQLNHHPRVVLQAPPGAGKTTAVPIALLQQTWLQDKQIIVLEPRRIAARNAAARMAFLLNEKIGETVGYQIRQDKCLSAKTKILVVTEGILTRKLQADPEQANTALIIFDEFHERSLDADLSLALCLQSQQILNEELKILVMSATLNTASISSLLKDAPLIKSEGRSYPIETVYVQKTITHKHSASFVNDIFKLAKKVIVEHSGSCLVFLPGVKEINQLSKLIATWLQTENIQHIMLAALHGSLNKNQQDQAISASAEGMRKIVLATNIAETSLTIDGIDCVIDSGLERVMQYNPSSAMNNLTTQFISADSATQRAGRAGRLSAGTCYRLWTSQQQSRLLKHSTAEILHSDLTHLVLELAHWGVVDVDELSWIDLPPSSAIAQAKTLLKKLSAIDNDEKITPHGQQLLSLACHPRLAHMMVSANDIQQVFHACLIASILSEKDLFLSNTHKTADIHDRLAILCNQAESTYEGINRQQCKNILQTADEFFRRLKRILKVKQKENTDFNLSGVLLAYAYPDRIAKQRHQHQARYLLSNGKGAMIAEYLQHHLYEYLVVANLDAKSAQKESTIYLCAEITASQLDDYFADIILNEEKMSWNENQQRVEAKQLQRIDKLILNEQLMPPKDKNLMQTCLLSAVKEQGLACLNWSPAALQLKQRLVFIQSAMAENVNVQKKLSHENLPDFSDEFLNGHLADWLQPHLTNENSLKQLQKLDLLKILESGLSWQQQQLINALAPEKITVPSGSQIKIDYSDVKQPVLAVRLQEVFGLYETPVILKGECQLMMHLLSPARRPMQVTQDLNSFWRNTYQQVKKELRGKYKRHYWPDDPFSAQATSKTKKNM